MSGLIQEWRGGGSDAADGRTAEDLMREACLPALTTAAAGATNGPRAE